MDQQNFNQIAHGLVNKEVEVITTDETYTGTLLGVGSDVIILRSRIRGRLVRIMIRIASIVAIFRFKAYEPRGNFWGQPFPNEEEESSESRDDHPRTGKTTR
jgi:hypothetical protein